MVVKTFPRLFKKNSKGKIQIWDISILQQDVFWIVTSYGESDGKIQTTKDPISEGKNIGRSNETSPEEQAISEAKSNWTYKQEREGYVQKLDAVDEDHRDGVDPMLAHRYDKHPHKINFPCFTQPKLDGHRCLAVFKDNKCTLFSRTRNVITGVPHINQAIEALLKDVEGTTVLDGELYNHDYKSKFEELTGFIRSQTPKEGHEVVQYHLYDLIADVDFESRNLVLNEMKKELGNDGCIRFVDTHEVTIDDVVPYFRKFREAGYEGGMLRNKAGKYSHKRSYDLLKVKEFDDSEFTIVEVGEGRGKLKGHAIFECVIEDGETRFEAKLKGPQEKLAEIYQNKDQYLGKLLTVQFQGRTKNNIPRFPVGVRVRQDV